MINISVCIATYNGSKFIKEQLQSILIQLGTNDEIIISDDSSNDDTIEIIENLQDPRIKIYKNNKFKSHIKNFEFALSKANGNYIFLSDQDDVWLNNKISNCINILDLYDLVVTDCIYVSSNGDIINESYFLNVNARKGLIKNFIKNSYLGCCMAFNRKILKIALPFPNNINSHDNWIGMIAEMFGNTYFLNKKLLLFRRHGLNFSTSNGNDNMLSGKSPFKIHVIIYNRFILFFNLIKRYLKYFYNGKK